MHAGDRGGAADRGTGERLAGPSPAPLAGLVGYTVASAACALAPSIGTLIALRVIQGLAGGVGVVIARAVVRDLFDGAMAARMFALLMMVTGVAPVFAPLVGGQALAITSWRGIFVLLAAIGVPLFVVTLRALPETLAPEGRHGGGLPATLVTLRRLLADRSFSPYALVVLAVVRRDVRLYRGCLIRVRERLRNVAATVQRRLRGQLGRSDHDVTAQRTPGRARGTRRAAAPRADRRGGGRGATLVVTVTHAGIVALLVSLFLLLAGNGLVLPNGTAAALANQPGALGSASALLGLGQFGCGAVVAPLVGVAGSHDALPMAVVIAVCGVSALAVNVLSVSRTRGRDPA